MFNTGATRIRTSAKVVSVALFLSFAFTLGSSQGQSSPLVLEVASSWVHLFPHALELDVGASVAGRAVLDPEVTWAVLSGPGEVAFTGAALQTQATFSQPGAYELRVTVSHGGQTEHADMRVEVVVPDAAFFVSPEGDDRNDGRSFDAPFRTIRMAAARVRPGDVVMLRGGVYEEYNTADSWVTSGEPDAPITFMSYPGEEAVIDGSHHDRPAGSANPSAPELVRIVGRDWYVFDGIVFRNSIGRGLALEGSHHVVRNVTSYSNHGDGIFLSGDDNLVEDSTSFDNFSRSNGGESADGLKIDHGQGNVVRRVIAFENSDDGFDLWASTGTLIEHSVAYGNGRGELGNGVGFKLSRSGVDSGNVARFNVGHSNRSYNFSDNGGGALEVYNNTSFAAGIFGFVVRGRDGVSRSRVRNNISFDDGRGILVDVQDRGAPWPDSRANSWDLGITDPKFISTNPSDPRFLRLSRGSRAIDAGEDVGFPYEGSGMDLGAFEAQAN